MDENKLNNEAKIVRKVVEPQALPPTQQPFDFRSRETENMQNEIYQQRVQRARKMRVKRGPPVVNNQDHNRGGRRPLPPGVDFRMRMKMNARFTTNSTSDLMNNSSFITRDNY